MTYVDGFLIAVPKRKLAAYRRMARACGKIWREHGALEFRECAGDDLTPKMGAPFGRALRLKRGETAVFSWIAFKSRKDRDRVNAEVMSDKRMAKMLNAAMPFDVKRMYYGGFDVIVDA